MPYSTSRTTSFSLRRNARVLRTALLAGLVASSLSACVPLVIGTVAAGGAWIATDRRSSGAQADDEALEIRGKNRIKEALQHRGQVNVTSYNRIVLLTGQVPSQADKDLADSTARGLPNARSVVNEITVGAYPSGYTRDALTSTRVRTALIGNRDAKAKPVKVTTENGTVYLMGIVTQQESDRAAEVASGVSGVVKVVKVFEIMDSAGINNAAFPGIETQPVTDGATTGQTPASSAIPHQATP